MEFSAIKDLEARHGMRVGTRHNLCFVRGEGNRLFDTNGKAYLDLASGKGENCFGCQPWLSEALAAQARELVSVSSGYYSEDYATVLEKLVSGTGFSKASLMNGASDATVFSMSLIKDYYADMNKRRRIITAAADAYRGRGGTFDIKDVPLNDFSALKELVDINTAALIIAPVQVRDGVVCADYDYLVNAYALCKSLEILFISDESRIGLGRTGQRFAFEHYGIQPDIVILSRGLASGLPMGAVLARNAVADCLKTAIVRGDEGLNLLSLRAANLTLDRMNKPLLDEITEKGEYLVSRLSRLKKHNFVLDVRGKGLLAAVELKSVIMSAKIVGQMEKLGYLLDFTEGNALLFSPPFTITKLEIDEACDALAEIFASTNV